MHILFRDGSKIQIDLVDSSLSNTLKSIYKHLQHVDIPFRSHGQDNPLYLKNSTFPSLVDTLVSFGKKVAVEVDRQRCICGDQDYYNYLHLIYEKNYNGDPKWLDYHEHIHICENKKKQYQNTINLDYREKAGILEKKFNKSWLEKPKTKVFAGDVFVAWAELGKTPYSYWENKEPNDIDRLCELAKPWLKLRPKLLIALEDIDFLNNKDVDGFNTWWAQYQSYWCRYWGYDSWTLEQMHSVGFVGTCLDIDKIQLLLKDEIYPSRIRLS